MTVRGAALCAAPLALVAAGAAFSPLFWLGLGALLVALVTVAVDSVRAPAPRRLTAARSHPAAVSVREPVEVSVQLGGVASPRRARVRDELPAGLGPDREPVAAVVPGGVRYRLTPEVRGVHDFGAVGVRVEGPLRLGFRQGRVACPSTLRVTPDIVAVARYEALARRGRLEDMGVRSTRWAEGTEFERIREATPDDPPRRVNWRATARTGRLMAVEMVPERAQTVVVCLDRGRLMGVGAGLRTKLDAAVDAALLLGHVALRSGDRVGLFVFDDGAGVRVTPRAGRRHLAAILEALQPLRAVEVEADHERSLGAFAAWQRRRSLAVVLTDIAESESGVSLARACARLRRRHLPLVATVRDPSTEGAAARRPQDATQAYMRAVAGGLLADRATAVSRLRAGGVEVLDAGPSALAGRLVDRYLEIKRRGSL